MEAELLEDEGVHGGRATSLPWKFTTCRYLLMASIWLSYTNVCCTIGISSEYACAFSAMQNTSRSTSCSQTLDGLDEQA
jgi:hypothetical protein